MIYERFLSPGAEQRAEVSPGKIGNHQTWHAARYCSCIPQNFKKYKKAGNNENLQATANFLLAADLPASHIPALIAHGDAAAKGVAAEGQ